MKSNRYKFLCLIGLVFSFFQVSFKGEYLQEKSSVWFGKLEAVPKADERAELGHRLFFDPRLSATGEISCVTCHSFDDFGTNKARVKLAKVADTFYRDIPSVLNASQLKLYGWDGRKISFAEKVILSLESEHEMGEGQWEQRLERLLPYKETFDKLYPEQGMNKTTIADALVEYQKQLITPAPIDDFIDGKEDALTEKQLTGFKTFVDMNCAACHTGPNFGGQMHQKMGIIKPWPNQKDLGYFHVSDNPELKMVFRVAPLRNVVKTAPYFHDASSRSTLDAIRKMGEYESGIPVDTESSLEIYEFLKALTGEVPEKWTKEPELPE